MTVDAQNKRVSSTGKKYKIMSFNILYADNAPGFGTVDERRPLAVKQIKEIAPDFVGMQECTEKWFDYLCEDLGCDYGYVGELNDPDRQRWRNPIFYRKDRFDLVETKTRWLTKTPDVQSKLEEPRQYRIVTHVLLRDKETGKQLVYCNMRGTFPNGNMLDFCFVSLKTVNVTSHRVEDNIGASDHNPIVIRFSLN